MIRDRTRDRGLDRLQHARRAAFRAPPTTPAARVSGQGIPSRYHVECRSRCIIPSPPVQTRPTAARHAARCVSLWLTLRARRFVCTRDVVGGAACAVNTYSLGGTATCSSCLAGSFSTGGASACSCAANFYSTTGTSTTTPCTACPAGSFSVAGATVCTCSAGYYSPDGLTTLGSCTGTVRAASDGCSRVHAARSRWETLSWRARPNPWANAFGADGATQFARSTRTASTVPEARPVSAARPAIPRAV